MTKNLNVALTDAQVEFLRLWGTGQGYQNDADIIRAGLRLAFGDELPPDPPARGGFRTRRPLPGSNVILLREFGKHRKGTGGVVGRRTRHGAEVSFASETILVPYRYLKLEDS